MSDQSVEQRVKNIIVEQLGVKPEQVTSEAKFIEDLGADSLFRRAGHARAKGP